MDDGESGSEGQVWRVDGVEQENGVDEDDEVNGDDLGWVRGGVLNWAEVNVVGVGVNVDESLVPELVRDDGLGDDVGECCHDVQKVRKHQAEELPGRASLEPLPWTTTGYHNG